MELNRKIDATIISKIADRKDISKIKSEDVLLGCLNNVGCIADKIKRKSSPVSFLTPLFLHVTLLARKANVDLGAILDSEQYNTKLNYNDQKTALTELTTSLCDLSYCSLDLFRDVKLSKKELEKFHLDAVKSSYVILKNINLIAILNNSEMIKVQKNVIKHLDQLIKII